MNFRSWSYGVAIGMTILCLSLVSCSGGGGDSSNGGSTPAPASTLDSQVKNQTNWKIVQTVDK